MPFIDTEASALITKLREERGLSPEDLAAEIRSMARKLGPAWTRGTVDPYTIRRIEGNPTRGRLGLVPGTRVQFVIAHYFGLVPHDIWKPGRRFRAPGADPTPATAPMQVIA